MMEQESLCQPLWRYGLFAMDSEILIESAVSCDNRNISICGHQVALSEIDRILIVGAGKAGAGMSKGVLKSLARGGKLDQPVEGIVIVPDNCVEELGPITLHGGRPAGLNEPTQKGMEGAARMLEMVRSVGPRDLVICLVSGGGSALAPLPVGSVSLESKQSMTRFLSRSGANINELNYVRSSISQIKGGGLVRNFAGHSLHALIISDVLGNPLETIASGMTVPQFVDHGRALSILKSYDPEQTNVDRTIYDFIESGINQNDPAPVKSGSIVFNHIVGDNRICVNAIANMGQQLGYEVAFESANDSEGDVGEVASRIWRTMQERIQKGGLIRPYCFVSGGEPTVTVANKDGKGGRNQHLALLILDKLKATELPESLDFEFVSIGTDGEDGPTDAAGAKVNREILDRMRDQDIDPQEAILQNNSYPFLDHLDALIKTGPTHTNVCDIRILVLQDNSN